MVLQRFEVAALRATPWKNGGGTTREVAVWPPGASVESFDWRVSIAAIAASGPFSAFEGIDRTIVLLEGDGVHLRAPARQIDHRLDRALEPFAFPGDVPLDCTLLGHPSTDFNVMARRGRVAAAVRVLRDAGRLDGGPHGVLLAVAGRWRIAGELMLAAGQGAWWAGQAQRPAPWQRPEAVPLDAGAILLAVPLQDVDTP